MRRRVWRIAALVVAILIVAATVWLRPDLALRTAAGMVVGGV